MFGRGVELLKAYRTAHSRVLSIEPFEAALRENTPLASISDPKALTEYLSQISLKGDMVMEELKRVTSEKDDYKKQLEEAQKSTKAAFDEVTNLKQNQEGSGTQKEGDTLTVDTSVNDTSNDPVKSPTPSTTSKVGSIGALFSPKPKSPQPQAESEEFFSFDNELPRLESELKERQEEVATLKASAESLRRDLSVARESTEGMAQNLESATRELVELRDTNDKHNAEIEKLKVSKQEGIDALKEKLISAEAAVEKSNSEVEKLKSELKDKADELEKLRADASQTNADQDSELGSKLEKANKDKEAKEKRLGVLQGLVDSLRSQLKSTEENVANISSTMEQKTEDAAKLQNIVNCLDSKLKDNTAWQSTKDRLSSGQDADLDDFLKSLVPTQESGETKNPEPQAPAPSTGASASSKKKKNKKKKGGKGGDDANKPSPAQESQMPTEEPDQEPKSSELEKKIEELTQQLGEKEAAIDRLNSKLKGEEGLKEEIESLRDDLLHIGQGHVEAKDKVKELLAEKTAMEETIAKLEKELTDLRTSHESKHADSQQAHDGLKTEFETLKVKSTTLETELSAAQQLAATRFKDLTDLRDTLQKIQPELRTLRSESSELKSTKETLTNQTADLKAKHDGLNAELKKLKSTISERDSEVKTLNQKIRQETDSRLKAEESLTIAQSDLRYSEGKKQEAVESKERTAANLIKSQDELKSARAKMRDVEGKVNQLTRELESLREEIQLKTAQHASAQSLMTSMRDQTAEMAMQMKEAKERCESLEEELADAHRLLSERTREGETMRRLLNDIEGRTESKVRDFRERMEAAIEERDRAEDDASTQGRRRARELEELKGKIREVERSLRTAEQDREELEYSQRDWRRRREDLEAMSERSTEELKDARETVARLRDSLDESEKQVRELEKEKTELRRSVEETNNRLEKLRKSSRSETRRGLDSGNQSSRSSIDSGPRRGGLMSPGGHGQDRSRSRQRSETPSGPGAPSIDYIYLKNVLLQFLEQKDKNYQKQLIPVLGMLLHFDR